MNKTYAAYVRTLGVWTRFQANKMSIHLEVEAFHITLPIM